MGKQRFSDERWHQTCTREWIGYAAVVDTHSHSLSIPPTQFKGINSLYSTSVNSSQFHRDPSYPYTASIHSAFEISSRLVIPPYIYIALGMSHSAPQSDPIPLRHPPRLPRARRSSETCDIQTPERLHAINIHDARPNPEQSIPETPPNSAQPLWLPPIYEHNPGQRIKRSTYAKA